MRTQRTNAYKTDLMTVFYIEQYNENLKEWFTVGDTYENIESVNVTVNLHNLRELSKELNQA